MARSKKDIIKSIRSEKFKRQIQGFEEVIDLISKNKLSTYHKESVNSKLNEDFSLLNLLENDLERLDKLNTFFLSKMDTVKDFSQQDGLIKKQANENHRALLKILRYSTPVDSPINHQLKRIFNSTFKKRSSHIE